jgi:hypothetical protein
MQLISFKQMCGAISAAAALGFLSWGLTTSLIIKGIGSAESAAWVQAVGATLGLAIAIWLPYEQKQNAAKEETRAKREMEVRVCLAIQDELLLIAADFNGRYFREIVSSGGNQTFDVELASGDLRFHIFEAMTDRLTEITNHAARRAIIKAYSSATELHDLLALNTRTLHSYNQLILVSRKVISGATFAQLPREEKFAHAQLKSLREQLRECAKKVQVDTNDALRLLKETIDP